MESLKRELESFPKGSIVLKKHRNGKSYVCLNRREGSRIVSKYIGTKESLKGRNYLNVKAKKKLIKEEFKENLIRLKEIQSVFKSKVFEL